MTIAASVGGIEVPQDSGRYEGGGHEGISPSHGFAPDGTPLLLKPLLSRETVAEILGITPNSVSKLFNEADARKRIPYVKVLGRPKVRPRDLHDWLERQQENI